MIDELDEAMRTHIAMRLDHLGSLGRALGADVRSVRRRVAQESLDRDHASHWRTNRPIRPDAVGANCDRGWPPGVAGEASLRIR